MKRIARDERGMALALAIVALVIVGALVAGAFFSATQEQRAGSNTRGGLQAFGAAEEGGYEVIDNWVGNIGNYNTRRIYGVYSPLDSLAVTPGYPSSWTTAAHSTGLYGGYLYKLNGELYLVDMTGRDSTSAANTALVQTGGGGRMRLGLIARIRPLQLQTPAALTTGNGDAVGGGSVINGVDQNPGGWASCGPLDSTRAGIRAASGNPVTITGNATVIGSPPVLIDTSVHNNTFSQFGGMSYTQLASQATITLPVQNFGSGVITPLVTNGQCDHSSLTNWGDGLNPTLPCGTYFPIVHITGTGTSVLNGVQGQGILLVDGSLSVQGGFQWFGIAIIQGSLKTAGGGGSVAHFFGATMVHDSVSVGSNQITGAANLLYSTCAIQRALEMTQPAALMRSRSWVALF
jgi:hypothetical protein